MFLPDRVSPVESDPSAAHTVQNFGPDTTAIVYGLQSRAVQVHKGSDKSKSVARK